MLPRVLLVNGHFNKLWSAQILSQVAQNLLNFALIIRVFELALGTRFANVAVSLLILSFGIPSIFFAAWAGAYVDYWDRRKVMVAANLLRGLLALGYIAIEQNLWALLALSFVISAIMQFFVPAEAASIPVLVERKHLLSANSLFVFTMYASFIIGYGLAAPLTKWLGPHSPYAITAVMFLLAAWFSLRLPSLRPRHHLQITPQHLWRTIRRELRSNWRTIRRERNLSFPILQLTVTQALVGVMLALAPALSVALLRLPLQDANHVLVIPAGVGMVAGVVLLSKYAGHINKLRLINLGTFVAGLALVLLGLAGQLHRRFGGEVLATPPQIMLIVGLLVLILGFANAWISAASQTLLQEHTTDQTRGKVFGALNMLVNIAATLPVFLAGILADIFSVTQVIVAIGGGVVAMALLQLVWLVRHPQTTRALS